MKNIVLTGFMASGKTSVGSEIARISKLEFIDTDALIEQELNMTVSKIFEKFGEEFFRKKEKEVINRVSNSQGAVIATGGGAVLDKENMQNLRKNGVIFNLEPTITIMLTRLSNDSGLRPLAQAGWQDLMTRFGERKPFYDDCDYKIHITEETTPRDIAIEIISKMKGID